MLCMTGSLRACAWRIGRWARQVSETFAAGTACPTAVSARPALRSAVDAEHLAGDELSQRAGEEIDDAGHLVDQRDPIEGPFGGQPRFVDLARPEVTPGARVAGGQAVHVHVVFTELHREAASVLDDRRLG